MNDPLKESIDFYNTEAESYDKRRWSSVAGKYIDRTQKDIVLSLVGECAGKKVLDIAAGTGRFSLELAKRGADVTVLDSSENMLAIIKKKFKEEGLSENLKLECGTATDLPFSDEEFDVCVCINALNHIPGQNLVLGEIQRVLCKNGLSVTNYTNWFSYYFLFGLWVNLRQKSVTRQVYTKWFWPGEVFRLHNESNLKVEGLVGAVQFPTNTTNTIALLFFKFLDAISRRPFFRYFATLLFIKARKS